METLHLPPNEDLPEDTFNDTPEDVEPFGIEFGVEQTMDTLPRAYVSGTAAYFTERSSGAPLQDWGDTTED